MDKLTEVLEYIAEVLKTKNNIEGTMSAQDFSNEVLKISTNVISKVMVGNAIGFAEKFRISVVEGVEAITKDAYRSKALDSITLPSTLKIIGNGAFYNVPATRIDIPASVEIIEPSAFDYSKILTTGLDSKNTALTTIGSRAFAATSITDVYIPQNVREISGMSFLNSTKITTILVDELNQTFSSRNSSGNECNVIVKKGTDGGLGTLVLGCTNSTFPDNVKEIGSFAFYGTKLTELTISDDVTTIGTGAFQFCRDLSEITLPKDIVTLSADTFNGCSNLISIKIPDNVSTIYSAFSNCINLTNVTFPTALRTIGSNAFNGCRSLKKVEIPNGAPLTSIGTESFSGCSSVEYYDFSHLTTPPTLANVNAFNGASKQMKIVVNDGVDSEGNSIYNKWIEATNWKEFGPNREDENTPDRIIKYTDFIAK